MSYEDLTPPTLEDYGVESIEWNTCEDNASNRRKLREGKVPFRSFEPGVLEIIWKDYGELNTKYRRVYDERKSILMDPSDPWSDYKDFADLPEEYVETAPAWIMRHMAKVEDWEETGEGTEPKRPKRCDRRRADGSRCWNWSWPNDSKYAPEEEHFCRYHSSFSSFHSEWQTNKLREAMRVRLIEMSEGAVNTLEDLYLNSTVPAVRLKAATEVLDRANIRGGVEVSVTGTIEHTVEDPAQVIRERLKRMAALNEPEPGTDSNIVDAEVIQETPELPSPVQETE